MARLLFVQNLEYEFLGPMYIAAALRQAGHECRLAFGRTLTDVAGPLEAFRPDLVGFSVMSGSHRWAASLARDIKTTYGVQTILGGAHATFFPEVLEHDGIDMVLRGEGEDAAVELMEAIDRRRPLSTIANIWHKNGRIVKNEVRPLRRDLDAYPFPDRHLYDELGGRFDRSVQNVITSRGCPWHCSFCFEDAMRELYAGKGKYVRLRGIDHVLEECRLLKQTQSVRTIYFADDVFGMSTQWLYEFLPRYRREVGLPFICLVRADIVAGNPEYAERLAAGGCASVFFGVESADEELRNRVLMKRLSTRQIELAARRLHDAKIPFRTYNIVGLPGETLEDALRTVELNVRLATDYPWCSVFSPMPGTALTEYAISTGELPAGFSPEELSRSFFTASKLRSPEIGKLENLQKFFQTAVLWPRTLPLIRRLVALPPNALFQAWFGIVYFLVYVRSERRSFWKTLLFGLRNWRHVLARE